MEAIKKALENHFRELFDEEMLGVKLTDEIVNRYLEEATDSVEQKLEQFLNGGI